jgi:hypothetical protein
MPNPIKYTTGTETLALKKGNFYIGTGDVGKGPSDTTGYYQGPNVPSGGYVIYLNKEGAPGGLSYHSAANDAQLIAFTNNLAGQSYTTVNECLVYFAGQSDKVVLNRDYEGIVTDGLVLNVDAGFTPSYPRSGTTWSDLSLSGNNGTLINGPTFNSDNGGSIVFDGTNDYVNNGTSLANLTNQLTINFWGKIIGTPGDGILITKGEHNETFTSNFGFQIGRNAGGKSLRLYCKDSGQSYTTVDSDANMWDNNIGNYVVVFNSGSVLFYKNGNLFSSHSFGLSVLPSTTGPLYIGFLKGYIAYYPGNIYSCQIYNRALSATEVLQNFNAQKGRFGL